MEEAFKTGDEVYLKVGGPKMAVSRVPAPNTIHCQWFAGKKLDSGVFPPESLVRQDPNPKVQPGG